ncbi:Mini-ribonuclease 3 [Candidatus Weimeria sp. HCP3S3_B5]|uniref:Mini-ribonuclease 3 n=1 Tax=Candidatus Weimeria sp. HCP3S3_B5 TaxID=3438871 RepID=UPI002A9EC44F|nr:ribonuclease III domain-containing protein [Lachnospiraceae bacterium]MDY6352182.1 ribonuclease III domain-containing protein [Lachnospiraceae bacterium]
MEEDLTFAALKALYSLPDVDIRTYSPLSLAFLGDGVYELIVRSIVTGQGNNHPSRLHNMSAHIVKASSQRRLAEAIEPLLSEREKDVLRRGRNAKSYTHAKNATIADYRMATGFEALLGYLFLSGQDERLLSLIRKGLDETGLIRIRPKDTEEKNDA